MKYLTNNIIRILPPKVIKVTLLSTLRSSIVCIRCSCTGAPAATREAWAVGVAEEDKVEDIAERDEAAAAIVLCCESSKFCAKLGMKGSSCRCLEGPRQMLLNFKTWHLCFTLISK